ncbi:hypothetical protein T492DRAFT_917133 [Pavlovales sp. CCMP2436]|nr:hypothetical protein T492DRAFT_917133 [Pavlovales sp. CCMP2436]
MQPWRLDTVDWAMSAPLLAAAAHEHSLRTVLLLGGGLSNAHLARPQQAVRAAMQAAQHKAPVAPQERARDAAGAQFRAGAADGGARAAGSQGGARPGAQAAKAAAAASRPGWAAWFGPAAGQP